MTGVTPSRAKVLSIDDLPANLFAIEAIMEPLDVEVVSASSGAEALRCASQTDFAVVLLDVMMPTMDGFEILARLRSLPRAEHTPVIFITARDLHLSEIERAYAQGAVDFVSKPVAVEILRAKVNVFIKLHQANQALRERDAALALKDRHIAVLAHDLRSPMNTITLTADTLLLSARDERTRRSLERVRGAAMRMNAMIENLFGFAREGHGEMPLRRGDVDLGELCKSLIQEIQGEDPVRAIELVSTGDLRGEWDAARLQQAISNLIGNALRYGEGQVRVDLHDADGSVEVSVQNAGPTIPETLLASIFEPFERGVHDGAGLGLGLYIVKAVASAHGGAVTVRSSSGSTTFTLRLPRATALPGHGASSLAERAACN